MKTLPHKFKDENGVIDLNGINGYIQALTAVSLELNHVTTDELGEIITNTLEGLRPILMEAWGGILSQVNELTEKGYDGAILQSIQNDKS